MNPLYNFYQLHQEAAGPIPAFQYLPYSATTRFVVNKCVWEPCWMLWRRLELNLEIESAKCNH